jgi:hypothetical protein
MKLHYQDGTEVDGKKFERQYDAMYWRFKNASSGVRHEDVLSALENEANEALLKRILNRELIEKGATF